MSRVVLGRPKRNNQDVAIVTIDPFPAHQVAFQGTHEVLDDFLRNHKRIGYRTIQPCPFGQAYVKLRRSYDRDFLIQGSPHAFGDVNISFVEHNKGWNNATTTMNHDVWLMLLGFNIDYWEQEDVEKAIADFGKVISWQEDPDYLSRILVKARVVNLTEIPWFIVCSEGEKFEGDCWTAQCEILQTNLLGGGPQDENLPPGPDDLNPNIFDFFGYGQQGNEPNGQHGFHDQQMNQNQNAVQGAPGGGQDDAPMEVEGNVAAGWGLCPDVQPPLVQQNEMVPIVAPQPEHGPVVIPQRVQGEAFLELNDFMINNNEGNLGDFNLNFPPPEDMGDLDELNVVQDDMEIGGPVVPNEQVIAEEDLPPILQAEPVIAANNLDVEVFIPMEDGHPLLDIGEEVQEDELLDHNSEEEEEMAPVDQMVQDGDNLGIEILNHQMEDNDEDLMEIAINPVHQQNIHLGFVELVEPAADPVFSSWMSDTQQQKSVQHPDAVRLWAKFLSPLPGTSNIEIPVAWSNFFTTMLLNPTSFVWAKEFLSSHGWEYFKAQESIKFGLPNKCPDSTNLCLKNVPQVDLSKDNVDMISSAQHMLAEKGEEETLMMKQGIDNPEEPLSPITPPDKIKGKVLANPGPWSLSVLNKCKIMQEDGAVVDSSLRRSGRQKHHNKGHKSSVCSIKDCLGATWFHPLFHLQLSETWEVLSVKLMMPV